MAVLVDTNVILDVLTDDPEWAGWAVRMLEEHEDLGLVIDPAIYAELAFGFESAAEVDELVKRFGFGYEEIPREGLFVAARAFRGYKRRGGTKDFVLPDFFVGGHASAAGHRLLTRDTGRYATYFPQVKLITPGGGRSALSATPSAI